MALYTKVPYYKFDEVKLGNKIHHFDKYRINTEEKCVQRQWQPQLMCWLNDLQMQLVKLSVHQKYDLQKKWEIWCAWSKEILTQNMSSSSIAAITSVALRLQQGEEVGRVARIPPPTKLVAAQFRIVLATPGTFLSTFWRFSEDLWCNVASELLLRPGPD